MPSKSQPEAPAATFVEPVTQMQAKAVDALSTWARASHRIAGELLELSSSAAKESLRACADIQAVAVEAFRAAPVATTSPAQTVEELQHDPTAWYRKSLASAMEGPSKAFGMLETTARILTGCAGRLQVSAERTGKEVQEILTSSVGRINELYGRN